MASAGFRQPQFSEDVAWLPPWLEPHQGHVFDEPGKDARAMSQQACKEDMVFLEGNDTLENEVIPLTSEEARYKSCHLYLSGDDNSLVGTNDSSGNQFLHFRLHLSSDGISQQTPSSHCNFHQTDRHELSHVLPKQPLAETSACPVRGTSRQQLEMKDGLVDDPVISKSGMSSSPKGQSTKDANNGFRKHDVSSHFRNIMNSGIEDAIELSIAASEALVISEMMKADFSSELLPASAIVEVALHVKQARKSVCSSSSEAVSDHANDDVDDNDLLRDLDGSIMSDAFEDVGLSLGVEGSLGSINDLLDSDSLKKQGCSSSGTLSRVLDTPISVNCGLENDFQNADLRAENVDFGDVENFEALDSQLLKDAPSKSGACKKMLFGDPCVNILNPERFSKSSLSHSDREVSETTIRAVDMDVGYLSSYRTPERISYPQVGDPLKKVNKVLHADRFTSRWLGGWTKKDHDVLSHANATKSERMPEFVARRTSFISESADIPDNNSLVKELEVELRIDSLSCKACEGSCSTVNKGTILSQDFDTASNLPLSDPLCSVVPCSISSDIANGLATTDNNLEVEKCPSFLMEHTLEKSPVRITGSFPELAHGDDPTLCKVYSASSGAVTCRQSTSLKNYSMLVPQDGGSERISLYIDNSHSKLGILGLPSNEKIINCNMSSGKGVSIGPVFSKPTSKVCGSKDCERAIEKPINNVTNEKQSCAEAAENEGTMQFCLLEERCSPQILNFGIRHRLQASKFVFHDKIDDVTVHRPSVLKMVKARSISALVDQIEIAENTLVHSSEHSKACKDPTASRKRVHFSDVEINKFQPGMSGDKLQSGAVKRTGKRTKRLGFHSDIRNQEVNACQANFSSTYRKKMIFQGLEFLLTGFSIQKEKELELLIRKQGGYVLSDIPPPPSLRGNRRSGRKLQQLPVVLSTKKLQTTKFLYGCAVNAFILKASWLTDSSIAGSILPPENYMILPIQDDMKHRRIGRAVFRNYQSSIFDKVGVMLHGKHSFWAKFGKIVKHGGGQVFKTLQWLVQGLKNGKISVGVIVAENEDRASRHLRQCASEQKLPMRPATWIMNCLYVGRLLPFEEDRPPFPSLTSKTSYPSMSKDLSEEM